jgi:hypothetical protein
MNKYRNIKTTVDGFVFDSKKEAARYQELKLMLRAGEIDCLDLQPKFVINVNEQRICTYIADFQYDDLRNDKTVVEDAKGVLTPAYRLKKKLMKAVHGIEVQEV